MKNYHYSQVKQAYDDAAINGRDYVPVKFGDSKWINLPLHIVKLFLQELTKPDNCGGISNVYLFTRKKDHRRT